MLKEGLRQGKEGENERAKQKGKMPVAPAGSAIPPQTCDLEEEIARLKKQIKSLQEKVREEENGKGKELRQVKRVEKEGLRVEEESWYGTAEAFPPYRSKNLRRRFGQSPFTTRVLWTICPAILSS